MDNEQEATSLMNMFGLNIYRIACHSLVVISRLSSLHIHNSHHVDHSTV